MGPHMPAGGARVPDNTDERQASKAAGAVDHETLVGQPRAVSQNLMSLLLILFFFLPFVFLRCLSLLFPVSASCQFFFFFFFSKAARLPVAGLRSKPVDPHTYTTVTAGENGPYGYNHTSLSLIIDLSQAHDNHVCGFTMESADLFYSTSWLAVASGEWGRAPDVRCLIMSWAANGLTDSSVWSTVWAIRESGHLQ